MAGDDEPPFELGYSHHPARHIGASINGRKTRDPLGEQTTG